MRVTCFFFDSIVENEDNFDFSWPAIFGARDYPQNREFYNANLGLL